MKLGFIGTGNMAGAIMGGIIKNGVLKPEEIIGSDILEAGREKVHSLYGICVTDDNKEAAKAEIVVLPFPIETNGRNPDKSSDN